MGKSLKLRFIFSLFLTSLYLTLNASSIAKIPEASGICYIQKSNKLIVVNDEGWIYRLTTKGDIITKKYLGDYDLEGVTYDKKSNLLLLAVEGKNSILMLNKDTFKIIKEVKIKKKYQGIKILEKSKNGIEAITMINDNIYIAKQSALKSSKDYVLFKIKNLKKKKAKITAIYKHSFKDIAGLCFYKKHLFMVSDKKNLLIKYSLKQNKAIQTIKLPKSAQEGICFDKKHLYIADDNGNILKYKTKKLGI